MQSFQTIFRMAILLFLCFIPAIAFGQSEKKKVLVHYMPWFASKPISGYWGWHWTMGTLDPDSKNERGYPQLASHHDPLLGLYDSNDPELLQCHVQLMKIAGIVDWYGIHDFRDYATIHRNTQHLVKYLKQANLKLVVCYEDQSFKHRIEAGELDAGSAIDQGKETLTWLEEHWFADKVYLHQNGQPLLLVFGPQFFNSQQWAGILRAVEKKPLVLALPHLVEANGLDGAFGWPPVSGGKKVDPADWKNYIQRLESKASSGKLVVAPVFPGFQDYYAEAKLHDSYGTIDSRNGKTFSETLQLAMKGSSPVVQIATWNDFGEGTVIEPTVQRGYRYLEELQQSLPKSGRYTADDLRLPVQLYRFRKSKLNDDQLAILQRASDLLLEGKCQEATRLIQSVSVEIDRSQE